MVSRTSKTEFRMLGFKVYIMKKNALLLLFIIGLGFQGFAQLPKGDRVLAWQVDMAENNNYDSAYSYAACIESIHFSFSWNLMEPDSGIFDATFITNTLGVSNVFLPAVGTKIELNIPTMNTVTKDVPADLVNVNFDDPVMINRFKGILDTIFTRMPDVEFSALNIGNESDIFMGADATKYAAYKVFLDSVVPYAKQLYFNLHNESLKVGTTLTHEGLTNLSTANLCKSLNNGLDVVSVTYYPLNNDFTMKPPTVVDADFLELVTEYPDTIQPIYFAECGYSTSDICNSSDSLQSEFYKNVFTAWDTYYNNIKYLTIFKTTDWSQVEVDVFAINFGIPDTIFKEYLRTLGVRTWDNNGTSKMAYETILCELQARNFCATSCSSTSLDDIELALDIQVYPNPVSNVLTIETTESIESITVYNNLGVLVKQERDEVVNFGDLPVGVYHVNILLENGNVFGEKIIKK